MQYPSILTAREKRPRVLGQSHFRWPGPRHEPLASYSCWTSCLIGYETHVFQFDGRLENVWSWLLSHTREGNGASDRLNGLPPTLARTAAWTPHAVSSCRLVLIGDRDQRMRDDASKFSIDCRCSTLVGRASTVVPETSGLWGDVDAFSVLTDVGLLEHGPPHRGHSRRYNILRSFCSKVGPGCIRRLRDHGISCLCQAAVMS